jgi:ribosomal protein L9
MPRNVSLLLLESVDSLGIVGDVVSVRTGYARNYLLPRGLASEPDEALMKSLASKREAAERQLRELRAQREKMVEKLNEFELKLVRSCNDLGMLYGSVTQKDIAEALAAQGFNVLPRDIRLGQVIKRVDTYHLLVKLDRDLEADIKLHVVPDRELPKHDDHRHEEAPAKGGKRRTPVTAIEGIGEKFGAKLTEAGVAHVDELLEKCADPKGRKALSEATGIDAKHLLKWANMADLMRIEGVGPEFAELLEAAGVDTVKELRNRDAGNLSAKIAEVNESKKLTRRVPSEATVGGWVEQAKGLDPVLTY